MKKFKYILILLIVFLFSGCSGNYNLTFNKDLSIEEELNISINNENDNYDKTFDLFKKAEIEEDKYKIVVHNDKVNIVYKEKYKSFPDYYINSKLYKMFFETIEYDRDNKGMTIKTESNFKLDDKNSQNIINSYDIENLNINLNIPFSVNSNNADKVSNNIYTWELKNNSTYKNIEVDFSYQNDKTSNIIFLVLVGVSSLIIIGYIVNYVLKNRRI